MIKKAAIILILFICCAFYAYAKDNWKVISIPVYPEVWVLDKDIIIEGRLSAYGGGLGTVVKVTIEKGTKIYFK